MSQSTTILIVPGLRDHVDLHWQTLLEKRLPNVVSVPPMGREDLDCARRVAAIEAAARSVNGPMIAVAHSGGCIMLAHWLRHTTRKLTGALLATPPDFESPMPKEYPSIDELEAGGWLPVPRERMPFPAIVAASRNDPLGSLARITALADDWGARLVDLGKVKHLNPASGFGDWPMADRLIAEIEEKARARA
ncbi:RBBP9/YdeN family alpha/beta hydrolase [Paracoccus sp. (in: a-proteobacteria)]|uniref:RBBP9/YdeN family alpha/beta hydrolase n=1 Tax=Paracoccus sp. TaxID=267 RepID=UPI003A8B8484